MKLNKNFLTHQTGNDTVIVPTANAAFSGVVQGNETLGVILGLLKENTTEQQIIDKMAEQYDAPRAVIEEDVISIISGLRKIGAIDAYGMGTSEKVLAGFIKDLPRESVIVSDSYEKVFCSR